MNKEKKVLFLASSSKGRQEQLTQANIPFKLIKQNADETFTDMYNLEQIVSMLAVRKMEHVIMGSSIEGDISFVLTADTMVQDSLKNILGKPKNIEESIFQIKSINSGPVLVSTGFCLEKKIFDKGKWYTTNQIVQAVTTTCIFEIPNYLIDNYITQTNTMHIAGSVSIEGYGSQFLKEIHGSYSGIIGLPLFEVRQALETLNFFNAV